MGYYCTTDLLSDTPFLVSVDRTDPFLHEWDLRDLNKALYDKFQVNIYEYDNVGNYWVYDADEYDMKELCEIMDRIFEGKEDAEDYYEALVYVDEEINDFIADWIEKTYTA